MEWHPFNLTCVSHSNFVISLPDDIQEIQLFSSILNIGIKYRCCDLKYSTFLILIFNQSNNANDFPVKMTIVIMYVNDRSDYIVYYIIYIIIIYANNYANQLF